MTEPHAVSLDRSDQREFDRRFEAERDRLVRLCRRLVGPASAEDVVHEAYLRGRSRFGHLRDADRFPAWVTKIAISICLNFHRSNRRLIERLPMLRQSEPQPRDLGLREAIEHLPPRDRALVVLHYGYGYQLSEIARMAGISAGNARVILLRARRRLASWLKDEDR